MSDAWDSLDRELAAWREAGRVATFWWRDDDAAEVTPSLARLVSLSAENDVPVTIAAIPATLSDAALALIMTSTNATLVQHGWTHANHAAAGAPKNEYPEGRNAWVARDELRRGMARLAAAGDRFLPVLTPPWNRMAESLIELLPGLGYLALSRNKPRRAGSFREVNVHVDPIDWRDARHFLGTEAALGAVIGHLRDRRLGRVDAGEPTGLLTHHLVQDNATWEFVALLQKRTMTAGGRWISLAEAVKVAG
ncbi:MAG: hypothetical protein FJX47_06355 [Alphaproteobacteria bacterium]|nr:hypothetical protein [Alphaproteobacteria bacterium]